MTAFIFHFEYAPLEKKNPIYFEDFPEKVYKDYSCISISVVCWFIIRKNDKYNTNTYLKKTRNTYVE
jgi:hypothetical protein